MNFAIVILKTFFSQPLHADRPRTRRGGARKKNNFRSSREAEDLNKKIYKKPGVSQPSLKHFFSKVRWPFLRALPHQHHRAGRSRVLCKIFLRWSDRERVCREWDGAKRIKNAISLPCLANEAWRAREAGGKRGSRVGETYPRSLTIRLRLFLSSSQVTHCKS